MVEIFGEVDKNEKGKVIAQMPSWYFERQKYELKEKINHLRTLLDGGFISVDRIGIMKEQLRDMEKRLDGIERSKPNIEGKEKDELAKVVKDVGKVIRDAQFTYSDMQRGTADAHEEARRMVDNDVVELKGAAYELAKKCNIPLDGNKTSRTGAEVVWKIGRKLLGDLSNTEVLRSPK